MTRTNPMPLIAALLALFSLALFPFVPSAHAGLVWQTEQITQGMPGQPDTTRMVTHRATEEANRTDMDHDVTIMNFNTMMIYNLDTQNKTYHEMNMNQMMKSPQMGGKDSARFAAMMEKMMGTITVIPTGETQNIEGYDCKKYNVSIMGIQSEYWVTSDIPHYSEFKAMGEKMSEVMNKNPMLKRMNYAAFTKDMDGFPVKVITNPPMGGTTISTLKKIEKEDLAGDLFTVPPGYTKTQ